ARSAERSRTVGSGILPRALLGVAAAPRAPPRASVAEAPMSAQSSDRVEKFAARFADELSVLGGLGRSGVPSAVSRSARSAQSGRSSRSGILPRALHRAALAPVAPPRASVAEVAVMDDAIDILAGLGSSGSRLSYNRVGDFLLSAHELLRAQPDRASELHGRMFQAVQMIESGLSDRAVSLTVARLAAEQDGVGAQIRRFQDAVTQRDDLRLELGREFSKDTSIRDQARVIRLNDALSRATERTSTLTAALGDAGPGIASLLEVTDAELSDVQSSLEKNEALLSFVFGREDGFAIAVRSDFVVSSPLPIGREALVARIQSLRRAFDIGPGQVVPRFDIDGAHALYQLLFGGISDALAGVDHTIVVTDGPLRSLPFGVLVTSPPSQSSDYSGARWLAQSFAISTAPTIRAFYQLRRFAGVSSAPKPVLGFGDPVLAGGGDGGGLQALRDHCQEDEPVPPALIRALEPLPATREEVATIGRLLGAEPGDVVLGASATEQRLRTAELDQYRILYFATHGLLPGEVRCQGEPAIVLTPPSRPSNDFGQDGLISASEIARLRLDADVVVLSACNTGSADGRFGGDALSGLSRAFFSAGARALLVSHWQIDSAVTSTLMQSVFQTAVGDRQRTVSGIARAMRRAQTRLIAQSSTAHPYFWGAFTFIGDGA
ncbi:MAG: CHAT domain-containing protein, partial [Pseudomonadota bacterium]